VSVPGYSYAEFCRGIAERGDTECWVRGLLVARRQAQIDAWGAGQGEVGEAQANWIPNGLLECDGPLDGMHLGLSKSWLKNEFPNGGWALYPVGDGKWVAPNDEGGDWHWPLHEILNDSRNGVCGCRRHHDLVDRKLIMVRRGDLPGLVEEFAAELGTKAVARLERDFGPCLSPVSACTGRGE
jgi:hypothetical protein